MHVACGFPTREEEYLYENKPKNCKPPIGAGRFPLWDYLEGEMQAMDLPRQILEGKPYPVKALFALGLNARMFPDSGHMFQALEALDFYVDTDLFLTDSAKYADLVLPACSSFERGEFKPYPGGLAWYTSPAIQPLGQSKSDVTILTELANRMDLPDEMLKAGYDAFVQKYILDDYGVTVDQLRQVKLPVPIARIKPHRDYEALERGLNTPTGKFELKSMVIAGHPEWGLDALPTYRDPLDGADPAGGGDVPDPEGHGLGLGEAQGGLQRLGLPVQVGGLHRVLVHEGEGSHPGAGQGLGAPAPHAPQAQNADVGGGKPLHGLPAQEHFRAKKTRVHEKTS